jgi:hypothetical protein
MAGQPYLKHHLNIKSLSMRKPCKIWKFVQKQCSKISFISYVPWTVTCNDSINTTKRLILTELRQLQEKNHPKNCQEKRIYRLSSRTWLYWPLQPKIFSTFDEYFIIICTDNEPPVQWFLVKFENRHTLIYLFWLYIKLSICILKWV